MTRPGQVDSLCHPPGVRRAVSAPPPGVSSTAPDRRHWQLGAVPLAGRPLILYVQFVASSLKRQHKGAEAPFLSEFV